MLMIKPQIMTRLRATKDIAVVQEMLVGAFTLELATIPTYLTGVFSIKSNSTENSEAKNLVLSVVIEEMLHLTLACNILIAIGGNPEILQVGLSLTFPTPLPMNVDEGLIVALLPLTQTQVGEVYMGIEHPDTQDPLPGETAVTSLAATKIAKSYASIGDFYQAILDKLEELTREGCDPFAHPRLERQVDISQWFPHLPCGNGKVDDMTSAKRVIDTIVRQGEGVVVGKPPIDPYAGKDGSFAHFFKFGEIFYGKRLIKDSKAPSGWSYSGKPVPLDEAGIYNLLPNAALSDYVPGSFAYIAATEFYGAYKRLLTCLNQTFNGSPETLDAAFGIMYELKLVAQKVVQHPAYPAKPSGYVAAPPFMLTKSSASS